MANESICCSINFHNEAHMLPGLLEQASRFFDNIFCIDAGIGGARSNDGSIEICERFGATVVSDDIENGFGRIRSRLIHDCGCTFAMLLDADERFFPQIEMLHCEGIESYPQIESPNLSVHGRGEIINQGAMIREWMSNPETMAIRSTRRHWFDFTMRRPCQNWLHIPDHQLRIVRNTPQIEYEHGIKMHERLIDKRTGGEPVNMQQDQYRGPFFDHFHMFVRRNFPGKKEGNEENYRRMERNEPMIQP